MKVILITIDALRYDCLKYLNLENYLDNYISFKNCYTAGEPTPLSFPSIFQSIYPSKTMDSIELEESIPTLAEVLSENGVKTAAFSDSNPYCSSVLGYDRGFDTFEDYLFNDGRKNLKSRVIGLLKKNKFIKNLSKKLLDLFNAFSGQNIHPKQNTKEVLKDSLEFIKSNKDKDFFLWTHLMDPHKPYMIPEGFGLLKKLKCLKARDSLTADPREYDEKEIDPETISLLKEMYIESIKKLGEKLDDFFSKIKDEETVVIITSDHGEEFYEHGKLEHQENVFEEVTHVPLVIKGLEENRFETDIEDIASLIDLAPTILNLFEITRPNQYEGINLLASKRKYTISETLYPSLNCREGFLTEKDIDGYIYSICSKENAVFYFQDNLLNGDEWTNRDENDFKGFRESIDQQDEDFLVKEIRKHKNSHK